MALTTRSNKGTPLSHAEMDANLSGLADGSLITDLNSSKVTFTPSGSGTVAQSVAAAFNRNWITAANFGCVGDGSTDDTTALQSAIDDPRPLLLIGSTGCNFKTTANLALDAAINNGKVVKGIGPFAHDGAGAGKSVITPSSAVSVVFTIDGTPASIWLEHIKFTDFSIDMTNMTDASTRIGFQQIHAKTVTYENVTVYNDGSNKRGWKFQTGAYMSKMVSCYANIVEYAGTASNDAVTTITSVSCHYAKLIASYATEIDFYSPIFEGALDKFVLSNVWDFSCFGGDIEGTGTAFVLTNTVKGFTAIGNGYLGFSGTFMSGSVDTNGAYFYQDNIGQTYLNPAFGAVLTVRNITSGQGGLFVYAASSGDGLKVTPFSAGSGAILAGTAASDGGFAPIHLDGTAVNLRLSGTQKIGLASDVLTFGDAVNIAFNTTTGTKIGTAAGQKIGFYGASPVAQQTGVAVSAAGIHAALVSLGLITA